MLLKNKILLGYLLIVAVFISITAILLYDLKWIRDINTETLITRKICKDINTVHYSIFELAMHGEYIIKWDDANLNEYRIKRLHVDSLLLTMKHYINNSVFNNQIDNICVSSQKLAHN